LNTKYKQFWLFRAVIFKRHFFERKVENSHRFVLVNTHPVTIGNWKLLCSAVDTREAITFEVLEQRWYCS
jgi:hypothetical protein